MDTLTEIRTRTLFHHKKSENITAFFLQAAVIESVIRSYVEARLKLILDSDEKYTLELLIEEVSDKQISHLTKLFRKVKWFSPKECEDFTTYFEYRNKLVHKLAKSVKTLSFNEEIEKHYFIGERILEIRILQNYYKLLEKLDLKRIIYGFDKPFGAGHISIENKNLITRLILEGYDSTSVAEKLKIAQKHVDSIIQDVLSTTIVITYKKLRKNTPRTEIADSLVRQISKQTGVDYFLVKDTKSRNKDIIFTKHICMYLLNKEYKFSSTQTANLMNLTDHTTALHAIKKIECLIEDKKVKLVCD